MTYRICCSVTGGRTGPRTGWLKATDGTDRIFDTEAEARDMVRRLDDAMRTFGGGQVGAYTVHPVTA
jgi:hypothetical protein